MATPTRPRADAAGNAAPGMAWMSAERGAQLLDAEARPVRPEICVEVTCYGPGGVLSEPAPAPDFPAKGDR